jgi:hypothetical protein
MLGSCLPRTVLHRVFGGGAAVPLCWTYRGPQLQVCRQGGRSGSDLADIQSESSSSGWSLGEVLPFQGRCPLHGLRAEVGTREKQSGPGSTGPPYRCGRKMGEEKQQQKGVPRPSALGSLPVHTDPTLPGPLPCSRKSICWEAKVQRQF